VGYHAIECLPYVDRKEQIVMGQDSLFIQIDEPVKKSVNDLLPEELRVLLKSYFRAIKSREGTKEKNKKVDLVIAKWFSIMGIACGELELKVNVPALAYQLFIEVTHKEDTVRVYAENFLIKRMKSSISLLRAFRSAALSTEKNAAKEELKLRGLIKVKKVRKVKTRGART